MHTPQSPIRLALAEDHALVREGLFTVLNKHPQFNLQIVAENGQVLLEKISQSPKLPDICLLDIQMPIVDGFKALAHIKKVWKQIKVITLTGMQDEYNILTMIRGGACAYILKHEDPAVLVSAIEHVHKYGYYHSDIVGEKEFNDAISSTSQLPAITPREQEFLDHVFKDMTYHDIARKMNVSIRTVDGYRESLFQKCNTKSKLGLVLYAFRKGFLTVNES